MALIVYAVTLFVSAFLLFLVQPIIGQKILPKLGGTPSVWNTCVVFFQLTLLAGYAYTHYATKLPVRRQIMVHCGLLLLPFLILLPPMGPFDVSNFRPVTGGNPMPQTFILLATIVGIPFFVVSTTAPLLQKWFGSTGHPAARDPYFLYGASNLGSMLSLLLYPVAFEPLFGLEGQSWFYTLGYVVLVGMVVGCGFLVFRSPASLVQLPSKQDVPIDMETPTGPLVIPADPPPAAPAPSAEQTTTAPTTAVTSTPPPPAPPKPVPMPAKPSPATAIKKGGKKGKGKGKDLAKFGAASSPMSTPASAAAVAAITATPPRPSISRPTPSAHPDEITWGRRFRWIGLAAVPSSLMLGVTTYMSTDISAIPLFWVMPLALYLLSFILVFMRWPINWLEDAHQYVLYAQPVLLVLLALFMAIAGAPGVVYMIAIMLLAFLATALACHGEMAKDRPSARHLTEFYLLMSVGGAVGGLFNGIIAPVIFKWGVIEFSLALFAAAMLRPKMADLGWTEMLIANMSNPPEAAHHRTAKPRKIVRTAESQGWTTLFDFVLPACVLVLLFILLNLVFKPVSQSDYAQNMFFAVAIPALIVACFFARPIRYGLGLGAILLVTGTFQRTAPIYETRSYFGLLRVQRSYEKFGEKLVPYTNLMHGTTNHGMALMRADDPSVPDLTRVATTYYHRKGPVGICMERFNWFSGVKSGNVDEQFTKFSSDARVIASFIGNASTMTTLTAVNLPVVPMVTAWSEPAYAVIGLGTGTMASYGHPYQTVHFYEIDEQIRLLSLPERGEMYFGYLHSALKRGANVKVLMGDARLRMAMPWIPEGFKDEKDLNQIPFDKRGGPEFFYHLMVVDAFSSDAIPRHLITKEAMAMYFDHLVQGYWSDLGTKGSPDYLGDKEEYRDRFVLHPTENKIWVPGGVLCVHTSNRHLKLVPVVRDTSAVVEWNDMRSPKQANGQYQKKTGLVAIRGHDSAPGHQALKIPNDIGHFTSEWVMVARDPNDLKHLQPPPDYAELIAKANAEKKQFSTESYWQNQTPQGQFIWTDDHSNLMAVFRWPWAHGD